MAVPANFACPDREKFHACSSKLLTFKSLPDDTSKAEFSALLDELNAIEYSTVIVSAKDGNLLLLKMCSLIALHEDGMIVKLCQIANTWMKKQMLHVSEESIVTLTGYLIKAVQRCQTWAIPEILRTMASLLYENVDKIEMYHDALLSQPGILVQLINNDVTHTETLKEAVMCLQCLTLRPGSSNYLSAAHLDLCYDIFCMLLHKVPTVNMEQTVQCKILTYCLRGIQNILRVTKEMPVDRLGVMLAAVRAYMFYGVNTDICEIPESLYPSPLMRMETPVKDSPQRSKPTPVEKDDSTSGKKSKRKTKKKPDKQGGKQNSSGKQDGGHGDAADHHDDGAANAMAIFDTDPMAGYATWSKVSSSDSEWSDTEGGQGARSRSNCTKVRQCALSCFYWISKFTEKKVMFSYWSSFIPDSQSATNTSNAQTLLNIILKDPSPKCRMGALAALSVLVDNTKLLLSAAEDSDDKKTATFTSFSVILGCTIKEMHRCMFLAMVSEDYPITLTQLIKCFGSVIANVPYHRMRPGLLGKIVKHVKHFIHHRDPNVRVACLTCLGSIAGIQPPLMEVCHIIQTSKPPVITKFLSVDTEGRENRTLTDADTIKTPIKEPEASGLQMSGLPIAASSQANTDSGFSSSPNVLSTSASATLQQGGGIVSENSGGTTPSRQTAGSSGMITPVLSDQFLQAHSRDISWVVKLCVKNVLPQNSSDTMFSFDEAHVEPLPIRLESLQVLANLTKGYFPVIRNCVPLLQELIHQCFCDNDPVVRLHTAKLLDEFTQVLQIDVKNTENAPVADRLDKQQVLEFWLGLLNGPIQSILQDTSHAAVKAIVCDCIANIGDTVFQLLPLDKRVMCLTVALGLSNDEDRFIKASAIRTLGIYVLYQSLREDVSFVSDCTSAIIGALADKNISVKVKAAWSLANLGDAIASNREQGMTEFLEEFSDVLLLNIITMATKLCQESDKIKPNGVRTLGNILRCMTKKHLSKETFAQSITAGMKSLVKCAGTGAMKVRWNACYALSNMYKNIDLDQGQASWNTDVLNILCTVVKNCKNFKVRINAAIALSSPRVRPQFGTTELYCQVWEGVREAFSTAEDISDYIDFRYRDNLTDQICIAAFRLVEVVSATDLESLMPVLHRHGNQLATCLDRYYTSRNDKSQLEGYLHKAQGQLKSLQAEVGGLNEEQTQCLDMLTTMCDNLTTHKEVNIEDNPPKLSSGFLQTYD